MTSPRVANEHVYVAGVCVSDEILRVNAHLLVNSATAESAIDLINSSASEASVRIFFFNRTTTYLEATRVSSLRVLFY